MYPGPFYGIFYYFCVVKRWLILYSFHGVGDFDVGQKGFGLSNFSEKFIGTPVFRKLSERGYLTLRYPEENLLGVRYEPWHVKVQREG